MSTAVTAFVFPGLDGAGHPAEHVPLLRLPGFVERWALVACTFGARPGFAAFDRALRAARPLPLTSTAWPWRALAVVAMQLAVADALERCGERAAWLCSYSLGDLARSCHAGAAPFVDLVAFAAALPALPRATGGTLAVLPADAATCAAVAAELEAAGAAPCRLSPRFLLVAGEPAALRAVRAVCARHAVRVRDVGACPLHAPVQRPLARVLAAATRGAVLAAPHRAAFSTLWARPLAAADDVRGELVANVASPIDFAATVERLREHHGVTRFVDLGPGHHAQRFVRHHGAGVDAVHALDLLELTAASA